MYDLDAAYAAQREAAKADFEFSYGGEKFAVPLSDQWPVEVTTLVANGDIAAGLKMILDARDHGQGDRFLALRPAVGHIKLILEEESKYEGVTGGLPNSAGSPPRVTTPT